ncbi:hypothetical protein ACOSQ2_007848 [Xanthoceras sorbifolium]
MASSSQFPLLLVLSVFVCIYHVQSFHLQSNAIVLPVIKDASTSQYVTQIYHGKPVNLVVDLGGPLIWIDCGSGQVSSSGGRLIRLPSQSIQCSKAVHDRGSKTCDVFPENRVTGLSARGDLVEDTLAVGSVDGSEAGAITAVDRFLLASVPSFLLQGLASGARGILGLGRTPLSLPSQLAASVGHHRKFFVCLSPSNGVVSTHNAPQDSIFGPEISKSLIYTPLIDNKNGDYIINIKSMKINSNPLSVNAPLTAKLSTVDPYTTMKSSIYETFTKAFTKAAESRNMKRVAPAAPFGVCFGSDQTDESGSVSGSAVPVIDLVLQSEMVKWRISGRNSMVRVNEEVVCLGFMDGGSDPVEPIVIGGFQLEDNLLEFDFGTSMLGFTSLGQTGCSNFVVKESL